jgi:ATP-binding cassette subfamily C protein
MASSQAPDALWRLIWRFAVRLIEVLRWRLALAALVSIALALAEGAGLLLLVPLLASIGLAVDDGPGSRVASMMTRAFAVLHLQPSLAAVLTVFVGLSLVHAVLYRTHLLLGPRLEQQFVTSLRTRLYAAIVSARWSYVVRRRTSDLVHAVTIDADRVSGAAYQLLTLLGNLAVSIVYVAFAARLSWWMTLTVGAAGLLVLWTQRGRTRHSADLGEAFTRANRRMFAMASQSLGGLKVAKTVGAEDRDVVLFRTMTAGVTEAYLGLLRAFAQSRARLDILSAISISSLLIVAVYLLKLQGAGLLLLVFVFARVMPRVMALQESAQLALSSLPSFRTVEALTRDLEAAAERPAASDGERLHLEHELRLDRVSYRYASGSAPAVDRVSLVIPAGRTVAIVGASGAGKSTIADLIMGLIDPADGAIAVDGRTLDGATLRHWRRSVGYVPQDGFLLHDSIRVNLRWANPACTEEEMWTALDKAAARAFVEANPDGLDAVVGERGANLSGGERQRLALARALLLQPDLLLLDEATSALDSVNEQQILTTLARLHGRVTIVIITHRLSTIRDADLIYVMDQGRVADSGQWNDLAGRDTTFRRLLEAQRLEVRLPISG